MNIQLFTELTTEQSLAEIEKKAESYIGLYVDMNDSKQRKFVKDQAADIKSMLQKLNRIRIDLSADYKRRVEDEAKSIRERLEKANEPFTLLIDEYTEERAKILAEEKARKEVIENAIQKDLDHEEAITLNRLYDLEFEDRQRQAEAEKQRIAQQAKDELLAEQQRIADAEKARQDKIMADKNHISKVRGEIKTHIMNECGITEQVAVSVVKSLLKSNRVTINY